MFVLGVVEVAQGLAIVDESAGRRDLGSLPLHKEPGDESGEYTESGEASYDTSSNSTGVGTCTGAVGSFYRRATSSGAGTAGTCRRQKGER